MTKTILLLVSFLSFYCSLFSQDSLPYKAERLITDFHGVVTNGSNILCYGDYGIITYSLDNGMNWQQLNIGDKYSIKKIRAIGNDFYGATGYSIIKSTNNGLKWINMEIFDVPEIITMTAVENALYILSHCGVWQSDLDLNFDSKKLIDLDSNAKYSEIESDGKNLFVVTNDSFMLRYNFASKVLDTVRVLGPNFNKNCGKIAGLKNFDKNIFIVLQIDLDDNYYPHTILKSENGGESWVKLADSISKPIINSNIYSIFDSLPYFIFRVPGTSPIYTQFLKIDENGKQVKFNKIDSSDRYINYYNPDSFAYTEIIRKNDSTLIAVGLNKLIAISYNKGKNWKIKSFIHSVFGINQAYFQPYIVSDSLIYMTDGLSQSIFKTRDGGATWLPQKKYVATKYINERPITYLFRNNGIGFCVLQGSGLLLTSDYGDSYQYIQDNPLITAFNFQTLNIENNSITIYHNDDKANGYTVLKYFDDKLKLKDSITIDSIRLGTVLISNDTSLFSLGLLRTKPHGIEGFYKFEVMKYMLMTSKDKGKTWEKVPVEVPIKIDSNYIGSVGKCFYSNGKILIPYLKGETNTILTYNIEENRFDSNFVPENYNWKIRPLNLPLSEFDGKIFTPSNSSEKLYYLKNFSTSANDWDSLNINNMLYSWDKYSNDEVIGKDCILPYFYDNSYVSPNAAFIISGKTEKYYDSQSEKKFGFKVNIIKLSKNEPVSVKDEANIEAGKAFLYAAPPYPIPAHNYVKSHIYWDPLFDINTAEINAYDIFGMKVNTEKLFVDRMDSSSGIMTWDCTNVANGVYLIRLSLSDCKYNLPVVIAK